ncbi:MAG: DedA family protein [Rubrobacteraceae bacterium]
MLGGIGSWAADTLDTLGVVELVLLLLVENVFPPIPSELILPLAGFLVGQDQLGAIPAFLGATAGSLLGAYVLYGLGRWGGRPLVLRYGRVLRISSENLDRAERWFKKYGNSVVFFARMVPGARSIVSVPAGMFSMPVGRFSLLTAGGSAIWNALLISAGYLLGSNWTEVSDTVGVISNILLVLVAVAIVLLLVTWGVRRVRL